MPGMIARGFCNGLKAVAHISYILCKRRPLGGKCESRSTTGTSEALAATVPLPGAYVYRSGVQGYAHATTGIP